MEVADKGEEMSTKVETYAIFDYHYNQKAEVNEEKVFFVSVGTLISSFLGFMLVFFLANILFPPLNEAYNQGQFWSGALFTVGTFASIGVAALILHKWNRKASYIRNEAERQNIRNFQDGMLSQGYSPLLWNYDVDLWDARGLVYEKKSVGEQYKIVRTDAFRDDDGQYKARVALVMGFYA